MHPDGLMSLLCHLATAYQCLESYELVQCAKCLQILPQTHLQTPWVQTCLAKAYLFTGRYKKVGREGEGEREEEGGKGGEGVVCNRRRVLA